MKEKVAKAVKKAALVSAERSVGKSIAVGIHEIEVPKELLDVNKSKKL